MAGLRRAAETRVTVSLQRLHILVLQLLQTLILSLPYQREVRSMSTTISIGRKHLSCVGQIKEALSSRVCGLATDLADLVL